MQRKPEVAFTPIQTCDHSFQDAVVFSADGQVLARIPESFLRGKLTPERRVEIQQQFGSDVDIIPGAYSRDYLNLD